MTFENFLDDVEAERGALFLEGEAARASSPRLGSR